MQNIMFYKKKVRSKNYGQYYIIKYTIYSCVTLAEARVV
jgi:hypothetical protein